MALSFASFILVFSIITLLPERSMPSFPVDLKVQLVIFPLQKSASKASDKVLLKEQL